MPNRPMKPVAAGVVAPARAARRPRLAGAGRRAAATLAAGLLLAALPGCGGGSRVGPDAAPFLEVRLLPADASRGLDAEVPAWVERRWAAENLGAGDDPGRRLRVRVSGGDRTLHEGWVRLPENALERPISDSGPLPVTRLRRPAVTLSMVGLSDRGRVAEGVAQARMSPAFLAALDRVDPFATLDEALWLAVLGLDADAVDRYADRVDALDAEGLIALREAGIGPSRLEELDAAGSRFTAEALVRLQRAGVTPETALELRQEGVATDPAAMEVAAAARRPARAPAGPSSVLPPTPADGVAARAPRQRLPPTPATDTGRVAAAPAAPGTAAATPASAAPAPVAVPAPATPEPTPASAAPATGTPASGTLSGASRAADSAASSPEPQPEAGDAGAVPGRFAELMGRLGYTRGEDLQRLFRARVEPRSVRDFVDAGHNPTVDELVAARALGIDGSTALRVSRAGYRFSVADLIELSEAGADADYAVALADPRFPPLSKDQLLDLKSRGVTPEQVQAIRNR